jgi:hypothetical protein
MKAAVLFALTLFSLSASGFRFGAPPAACNTMYPGHNHVSQTSPSPVRILFSKTRVKPDEMVEVTIESINPNFNFRGFMMQMRVDDFFGQPIGTFSDDHDFDVWHYFSMECDGRSSASHIRSDLKNVMKMLWKAPSVPARVRAQ